MTNEKKALLAFSIWAGEGRRKQDSIDNDKEEKAKLRET